MGLGAGLLAVVAADAERLVDHQQVGGFLAARLLQPHHRAATVLAPGVRDDPNSCSLRSRYSRISRDDSIVLAGSTSVGKRTVSQSTPAFAVAAPRPPRMQHGDLAHGRAGAQRVDLLLDALVLLVDVGRAAADQVQPVGLVALGEDQLPRP